VYFGYRRTYALLPETGFLVLGKNLSPLAKSLKIKPIKKPSQVATVFLWALQ
jgi:hypothetical protein